MSTSVSWLSSSYLANLIHLTKPNAKRPEYIGYSAFFYLLKLIAHSITIDAQGSSSNAWLGKGIQTAFTNVAGKDVDAAEPPQPAKHQYRNDNRDWVQVHCFRKQNRNQYVAI